MDLIGMKQLRAKIGADPTGEPFNSVMVCELHGGKPLNPLVNAGGYGDGQPGQRFGFR